MTDPRSSAFFRRLLAYSRPGIRGGRFLALEDLEHVEPMLGFDGPPGTLLSGLEAAGILTREVEGYRIRQPAPEAECDGEVIGGDSNP